MTVKFLILTGVNKMKVVILAGGLGTRLPEYTKKVPKPMVKVNNKPILIHIINHYIKFGFKDFIIAAGYKANVIKKYFKLSPIKKCKVQIIDTGIKSMTGGRLKRLKKYLGSDTFMMTYGDGLSNVNLKKLLEFHYKNKKLITLTAVRPPARFGAIKLVGKLAKTFNRPLWGIPNTTSSIPFFPPYLSICSRAGISDSPPSKPNLLVPVYFLSKKVSKNSAAVSLSKMAFFPLSVNISSGFIFSILSMIQSLCSLS